MLWDSFEEEARELPVKGPRCYTCKLLSALPPEGRAAVERAFGDQDITSASIRRTLLRRVSGYVPSAHAIARHRRGECLQESEKHGR